MSDEKYVGENQVPGLIEPWSVLGSLGKVKEQVRPEEALESLRFSRALLFPKDRLRPPDMVLDLKDFVWCTACRMRLAKSASYCSSCGSRLNPDLSYRLTPLEMILEMMDFVWCPVCRNRLAKSARYCSNCSFRLNPDLTHENSW